MGRDGWLGIGWPKEYGGQGRTESSSSSSSTRPGGPGHRSRSSPSTPSAARSWSSARRSRSSSSCPKILPGELHFSIGYTEPNAGTDLASLTTKAVKDGDEWVINGQKIYTSLASYADYIWLAARTDPDVPKHAGITIFLVPTSDPGFSYSKISHDGERQHLQHVLRRRAGGRRRHRRTRSTKGWDLIINQLNYERMSLGPPGMVERVYEEVAAGRRRPSCPTGAGWSTRSGCSSTWPGSTPSSSS